MRTEKFEKLVYKYLDGNLSSKESSILKFEMENFAEHLKIYNQIVEIRKAVSNTADETFKPFFENRVLENIAAGSYTGMSLNGLADSLALYFRKIVLTAAIMLALLITYNLTNGNKYSIENILGISKTNYEYAFNPLNNLMGDGK
jgi:hypothetical protein